MQRNGKLAAPISNTRTSDGFRGEHRKIGFCLWELKNHPNETKLYPFHKNLYKFDWSSR